MAAARASEKSGPDVPKSEERNATKRIRREVVLRAFVRTGRLFQGLQRNVRFESDGGSSWDTA